jgi:multicomponent Na+:H+ antiporter subunit C
MSAVHLYALASVALFSIGLHGLILHDHIVRKILALNIMSSGVFLFFVALANRAPDTAPDPVSHAMVLTGIVVSVSATALALAIVRRIHASTGHTHLSEEVPE